VLHAIPLILAIMALSEIGRAAAADRQGLRHRGLVLSRRLPCALLIIRSSSVLLPAVQKTRQAARMRRQTT
jgi:hypothetical protein